MKHLSLILLIIGGCVLTCGDLLMRNWVKTNRMLFYGLGLFVWMIGLNFLAQTFKQKDIAVASVIFVLFNVITISIVGVLYFKERLSGMELIGLAFGIIGIVILEVYGEH